jgi:hypothetical protein
MCLRIARGLPDDEERARWIAMAQQWLQWADEQTKRDGGN